MHTREHGNDQVLLSCWKDIANYVGKGVRTAQRWEHELSLPVRRPEGRGTKGPVSARPADLDNWLSFYWSERSPNKGHRSNLRSSREDSLPLRGNDLIETSRNLRAQNRLLVADLVKSLKNLRTTCSTLESHRTRPAGAIAASQAEAEVR
jgi:hypothetical protein